MDAAGGAYVSCAGLPLRAGKLGRLGLGVFASPFAPVARRPLRELAKQGRRIAALAFPDYQHPKAGASQGPCRTCVPRSIAGEFVDPVLEVGLRFPPAPTAVMVPEASMHENGPFSAPVGEVGRSGKRGHVFPVGEPQGPQRFRHGQLGCRAAAPNAGHEGGSSGVLRGNIREGHPPTMP